MSKETHTKWLEKYRKGKEGKIFELLYEIKWAKAEFKLSEDGKLSYLSAALSTICRDTRFEKDITELINAVYPEYYK